MAGRKCADCRLCKMQDTGYSNWTVEGTTVECMVNAHPDGSFDRWYGDDYRMHYANWCPQFQRGGAVHISVEGEAK